MRRLCERRAIVSCTVTCSSTDALPPLKKTHDAWQVESRRSPVTNVNSLESLHAPIGYPDATNRQTKRHECTPARNNLLSSRPPVNQAVEQVKLVTKIESAVRMRGNKQHFSTRPEYTPHENAPRSRYDTSIHCSSTREGRFGGFRYPEQNVRFHD